MSKPSSTSPYNVAKSKETGYVEVNRLTPCLGVCCLFLSCYTDWPDCIGAVSEITCCCLSHKHVMCKPAVEETSYCKFCLCDCDCDPMTTLCSVSATQTSCAVHFDFFIARFDLSCFAWTAEVLCQPMRKCLVSSISCFGR